jgi:hypothetical protein
LITGFNTDIRHNDRVYHIQTEDKGVQNPFIESLVYVGGEILASKKTSYAEHLQQGADEKAIGGLMEQQHKTIIAAVKRGRFDSLTIGRAKGEPAVAIARDLDTLAGGPAATAEPPVMVEAEKTLDQVIIDYLASEAQSEHLEMAVDAPVEFVSGQAAEFQILARKSISQQPIPSASIEVRVISTVEPPRVIFRGVTGNDGQVMVRCTVPVFRDGTAAVIVSAQSPFGNDEVKQLVKRRK